MTNIFVIGYYGHNNIGDEQYKISFNHIFNTYLTPLSDQIYNIEYIDCDLIKLKEFSNSDIIIIGGGDILNHYFLDQINKKFNGKPNKIIAISVGLPYNEILINTKKLSIIDYIFIRTQQDFKLFSQYYRADRIFYLPDISYYLLNLKDDVEDNLIFKKLDIIKENNQKIIAFCLNRHIYTKKTENTYFGIVSELSKTIKLLIEQGFYIVLTPFNTRGDTKDEEINMENDIIIHNHVYNLLTEIQQKSTLNIDDILTVKQTYKLFSYFYITVPMRFHACLFSIYNEIPMIPVFTTKKIYNFLLDINWDKFYHLETDKSDLPFTIDSQLLFTKINQLFLDQQHPNTNRNPNKNHNTFLNKLFSTNIPDNSKIYTNNKNTLNLANTQFDTQLKYEIYTLIDVITVPFKKETTMGFLNNTDIIIEKLTNKINAYTGGHGLETITDVNTKYDIIAIVSYYLTNGLDSKYNHGLMEKMFLQNYDYCKEWRWIIEDLQMNLCKMKVNSYEMGIFNMNYVDQNDYSDSHRSGWQYVINGIKNLNNEKKYLYMDLSIDKTFHWKENVNKIIGILPYTQNWVGFIHHTFDNTFSEYNNNILIKKKSFLDSLKFCKGLLVFSDALKTKLTHELDILDSQFTTPPIFVMSHPTEILQKEQTFSWIKFLENDDKKLLHIGGWLRNIFSFYALSIPIDYSFNVSGKKCNFINSQKTTQGKIRKVALKGRNMNNYFPTPDSNIVHANTSTTNNPKNCSQSSQSFQNNWNKHFLEYKKSISDSVEVLERVSNEEYDNLLTQNIVFLNLVDASAVNTILECIVRNTPIIVNNIPAVIELLGENYPLYYNSDSKIDEQVSFLMCDTKKFKEAHRYLKAMDKTKFTIEYFINDLTRIINSLDD